MPPIDTSEIKPFVPLYQIRTKAMKKELNDSIRGLQLRFEPEDIRYLIVNNESEITELIDHLIAVKERFPHGILTRLTSRIMTAEQIGRDI